MNLGERMQRQAVLHGVSDAIVGITRAHIVDGVYDADYWYAYDAGFRRWQEAEDRTELPAGHEPDSPPEAGTGRPHSDPGLAERGWAEWRGGYARGRADTGPAWDTGGSWAPEVTSRHPREADGWTTRGGLTPSLTPEMTT
jgi:hypothetical protein